MVFMRGGGVGIIKEEVLVGKKARVQHLNPFQSDRQVLLPFVRFWMDLERSSVFSVRILVLF